MSITAPGHGGPGLVANAYLEETSLFDERGRLRPELAELAPRDRLIEHKECICTHGDDMPEVRDRQWTE